MLSHARPSTYTDAEPPAFVWVNVHHPADTQQKDYRKFVRSSVTKEQHRKLRNDKGLKRSRSPTPTSPCRPSRRRRSSTGLATTADRRSPVPALQPDWLILLLPPYERALSAEDQAAFDKLARYEPALRTALQAMMIARHCRVFLHRARKTRSDALEPALTADEHMLVQQRVARLSGLTDLEKMARSLQSESFGATAGSEAMLTAAMADMIGDEAWNRIQVAEQIVLRRMSEPDFLPGCSDAAMATVAARLQCEIELAGRREDVRLAGQCCARLLHELEARVPVASTVHEETVDEWWQQFERVMGAPLSGLLTEPLVRHLVARSLEQSRDLLGPAMFAA